MNINIKPQLCIIYYHIKYTENKFSTVKYLNEHSYFYYQIPVHWFHKPASSRDTAASREADSGAVWSLYSCVHYKSDTWHAMVPIEPCAYRIDARGRIADLDARSIETADLWTQIAVRKRNLMPNLSADSESARKTGLETSPNDSAGTNKQHRPRHCAASYSTLKYTCSMWNQSVSIRAYNIMICSMEAVAHTKFKFS